MITNAKARKWMLNYYNAALALFFVLCVPLPVAAAPESPPLIIEQPSETTDDNVKIRVALQFTLGSFTGYLEKTPLNEVKNAFANSSVQEDGETGEHRYWLCYTLLKQDMPQRVWIISHSEMGGPKQTVTDIIATAVPPRTIPTSSCPALPEDKRSFSVDEHIKVGMKQKDLITLLGEPTQKHEDWLNFKHEGEISKYIMEDAYIDVRIKNNKIVFLQAHKITEKTALNE